MKYIIVFLFLMGFSTVNSQDVQEAKFTEKVQSLDKTIKTLYSIISGPQNIDRNWELFKFLFKDDAEITLTVTQSPDTKKKYYLKVGNFINTYGKWLDETNFYVKETERSISTFRHMNSVSSTIQYKYANGESHKGLNYINILKENNRWYISNLKWNQEISDLNLMTDYLPDIQN